MQRSRAEAITEVRAQLRQLERFRQISHGAAMVAHELINSLSSLGLQLALAIDDEPDAELQLMLATCEQVTGLMREFLQFARSPGGDLTAADARIDALCAPLARDDHPRRPGRGSARCRQLDREAN